MAWVTAAVGLAGAGLGIAQAVKQNKLEKEAKAAQANAASRLKNLKELNPYKEIQTPTLGSKMAMEQISQNTADSVEALRGVGAEGVLGGVAGLAQNQRAANLDVASNLEQNQFQRDMAEAQAITNIEDRRVRREADVASNEILGAQTAAADARAGRNQAIMSAVGGIGDTIAGLNTEETDTQFAKLKANKADKIKQDLITKGYNLDDPSFDVSLITDPKDKLAYEKYYELFNTK